jgi:hypothetical protein
MCLSNFVEMFLLLNTNYVMFLRSWLLRVVSCLVFLFFVERSVFAQPKLTVVNADTFLQINKIVRYNTNEGIELLTVRSRNGDSILLIVNNKSKISVGHLQTANNPRSREYWSLGGLSSFRWNSDSLMNMTIIRSGKSDSFKIDLLNSDVYSIYLTLYVIPDSLLNQLEKEGLGIMTTKRGKPAMLLRAGIVDSLELTEGVYRLIKISPVCRDPDCRRVMVFTTAKYNQFKFTTSSFLAFNVTNVVKQTFPHYLLMDSIVVVTKGTGFKYIDSGKRYGIYIQKDFRNGSKVKLSVRNLSTSPIGIIPPKNLAANKDCEWTVGSYLILTGCLESTIILKMLYLAPGERVDYLVNVGNCPLYNFYIDLCLDVDRIASEESGKKPTLELKDGKNYVEVPYSNSILETPQLFHSISIRKIGRDKAKSKPIVKVWGYE